MIVIGLTGPSGAGKGMTARIFEYYNIQSADADAVYDEIISPPSECLDEIKREFGDEVINSDSSLNRAELGRIVFSDKSEGKLEKLNSITHKYIIARYNEIIEENRKNDVKCMIIDAPLLFEAGLDSKCDFVISVIADKEIRIKRITERDSISREKALLRINAQKSDEFYTSKSDFVIFNNGGIQNLKNQIDCIMKNIGGGLV